MFSTSKAAYLRRYAFRRDRLSDMRIKVFEEAALAQSFTGYNKALNAKSRALYLGDLARRDIDV